MATYSIDAKELNRLKPWKAEPANQRSLPLSSDTLIARTAVTPKTRIVVVRTTSSIQDENGEDVTPEEPTRSKSVELPPMFTNGRTSVYLIRRPIPPTDAPKETLFYQSNDIEEKKRRKTTRTTTTTTDGYGSRSPTPTEDIVDTLVPPSHNPLSTLETRNRKDHPDSPTVHSPNDNRSRSPNEHRSSPIQSGPSSQRNKRRSRSRSKTRTRGQTESTPRRRSRNTKQRVSPEHHSPTSPPSSPPAPSSAPLPAPSSAPPPTKQEEPTEPPPPPPLPKRKLSSSSQTRNIAVQADLIPTVTERRTTRTVRAPAPRRLRRRKSNLSQAKSPRSVQLANSDDPTVIEIEQFSTKRDTTKSSLKSRPNSVKHTRFSEEHDNQSTEELMQTTRSQKCFGCLLRHMCLIVVICLILILIGLAGVGVSAYFLATDSQNDLIPKIIGIAIGGALVIFALCFLCIILGCIGSREGYFKYNGTGQRKGGRAFALISPAHPNAHRYIPADYNELSENKFPSASTIYNSQSSTMPIIHRQRTIYPEGNVSSTNNKNVTIEMPERLLTGRKMSPKSHERKLNKVVHHIGNVVVDAQKRYPGEVPTKVIVKMDEHVKATV